MVQSATQGVKMTELIFNKVIKKDDIVCGRYIVPKGILEFPRFKQEIRIYKQPSLTEIVLSDDVREFDCDTIRKCPNLCKIVINKNLETLHYAAFHGCKKDIELVFPESMHSLNIQFANLNDYGDAYKLIDPFTRCIPLNTRLKFIELSPDTCMEWRDGEFVLRNEEENRLYRKAFAKGMMKRLQAHKRGEVDKSVIDRDMELAKKVIRAFPYTSGKTETPIAPNPDKTIKK